MILNSVDLINTIIQSIFLAYIPFIVTEEYYKEKYKKVIGVSVILFLVIYIGTILGLNTTIGSLMIHIMIIIVVIISYNKDYKNAIIANVLAYFCIQINSIACGSLYFGHIKNIIPMEYVDISMVIFIYCPQFIMQYLIFKNIKSIKVILKDIINRKHSLSIIVIISISMQYLLSYTWIGNDNESALSKDLIMITAIVFIFSVVVYFANIKRELNEVSKINKALDLKINELKKVKHDYGAQISYLYGLHLMGRHERLGELLKDIINGNNSILDAVELSNNSESVISIILKDAVSKGINVVVDDNINLDDISMSELEFQRIVSNIINNSITAMDGTGLITTKAYKQMDNVIIKIQNNGPKIDDTIIDNIFDLGFSTKKNSDNGFGLAIVKEILDKYKGTIKVKSTDYLTEFKITIPIK